MSDNAILRTFEAQREMLAEANAKIAMLERVVWMAARASGGKLTIPYDVKIDAGGPICLVTWEDKTDHSLVLEARVAVDVIA